MADAAPRQQARNGARAPLAGHRPSGKEEEGRPTKANDEEVEVDDHEDDININIDSDHENDYENEDEDEDEDDEDEDEDDEGDEDDDDDDDDDEEDDGEEEDDDDDDDDNGKLNRQRATQRGIQRRTAIPGQASGDELRSDAPDTFGLTTFVVPDFDALSFVDGICSQNLEVDELDFLLDDLDGLQFDLDESIRKVEQMDNAVGKRIERSRVENEALSKELRNIAQEQTRVQEKVARQFRTLERKFGRASESAIGIGSRLEHLDMVKSRAAHAQQLLMYFAEFAHEPEVTSPLFTDFPRTLTDAAPYIHDLEDITLDLTVPGLERGVKQVAEMSGRVLTGLLDEFDRAATDGDMLKMRKCADAILENFRHKQGPENLFQRFIYHSLNPLLAARERSIGFRNSALRDNLAHLFTQIRSVVRTTHVAVAKVFPRHMHEIFALLVTRLFNDSVFGLQPTLQDFLFPKHRGGELAHNEFLQILFTAHKETEVLVQELVRGLRASQQQQQQQRQQQRQQQQQQALAQSGNPAHDAAAHDRGRHSNENAASSISDASLQQKLKFDVEIIHKQVSVVFEPFTAQYADREEKLFSQRISKRLFAIMPFDFVRVVIPDLEPPPGVSRPQRAPPQPAQGAQVSSSTKAASSSGASGQAEFGETDEAAMRAMYEEDAILALRRLFRHVRSLDKDFDEASIVVDTLEVQENWQEDLLEVDVAALAKATDDGRSWRLGDIEDIIAGIPPPLREDSFEGVLTELRGVPGQAIRWAYEAHKRCVDLLGPRREDGDESGSSWSSPLSPAQHGQQQEQQGSAGARLAVESVVLAVANDNREFYEAAQRLFQSLCERFFEATLIPLLQTVHSTIVSPASFREADGSSMLKALAEEMDLFDDHEQAYVVGASRVVHRLQVLPALATANASIKSTIAAVSQKPKRRRSVAQASETDEEPSLEPPVRALDLYLVSSQSAEEMLEQILLYWRDVVYPSLSKSPNAVSVCQAFLNNRLSLCESILADGLDALLNNACVQAQACALTLWEKTDYAPKEGAEVRFDRTTRWCLACVEVLGVYVDRISRLSNLEARRIGLVRLSYLGRDVLLGTLRRAKVSVNGSFTLVQDIGTLGKVFTNNPFCSEIPDVVETWDELRLISQLFIVQPSNLHELISDREGGLSLVRPRLLYECISRRSDFRTSYGAKAAWVKTLFAKAS
ncbi:Exocyst complex component 5 [Hondaea fermentalgiana]|uniref:Exocyst complex component 5 n=1 Tax=Hondaea fermentalgiana TaxID=2315210 RepID=A0A2R5G2B3_9STRA|nr:Exocyst complex component 5 [Hondaea fermentalgiana]|eukprot:GBG25150.1 Exocyst complex component 5 [Hondaea fermentalgiana]